MESTGYPGFVLYLILFVGIPLAFVRPFKSFLYVAFLLAAANSEAFTFTRIELFGPYFNANDACLLIALLSIFPYILSRTKKIQLPRVTKWIIAVLLIGFVQSWFFMGWTYETLRALRWALNLPIYFIVAATIMDNTEKVRPLMLALFLGSVVSAIEHIVFVRSRLGMYEFSAGDISQIRTIAFISPGPFFLLAGLIWLPNFRGIDRRLMVVAGALFATSLLLNQTRSIWISSVSVLPIALMLFRQNKGSRKIILKQIALSAAVIVFLIFITTSFITSEINPANIITKRFVDLNEKKIHTLTRLLAFKIEMKEWLGGTLIFGRGLSYFTKFSVGKNDLIAWGHLGHVTTLSQLGIIGLAVYSFYLPKIIIQASRKLWYQATNELKYFALFGGISMLWFWICFLMSNSFLAQHAIAGIIFGAVWRQAKLIDVNEALKKPK